MLENGGIGLVVGIELVNDVDGLRRHAELRHERIISDDLVLLESGFGDEVVELDAEENFAFVAELSRQALGHGVEILLFMERVAEEFSQLRVNGIRVVVAKEAEARIDFLFEDVTISLGKRREDFNKGREEIWCLRDGARFALKAPQKSSRCPMCQHGPAQDAFNPALHAARTRRLRRVFHSGAS